MAASASKLNLSAGSAGYLRRTASARAAKRRIASRARGLPARAHAAGRQNLVQAVALSCEMGDGWYQGAEIDCIPSLPRGSRQFSPATCPLAMNLVSPQLLVHFAFQPQPHGALGRGGRIGQPGVAEPDDLVLRRPAVLAVQVAPPIAATRPMVRPRLSGPGSRRSVA